ncbi:MAG: proline iminopeptidase-family hydrolase [Pseudomonadota bacterium]
MIRIHKHFLTLCALLLASSVSAQATSESPAHDWSDPESEHRVEVEGGQIWVRVNGDLNAEKAPAIFIHGGPGGTHMGFGNLLSMADERAIILYDQLGSGLSDPIADPAGRPVEHFVRSLEAIRAALEIERWHVVGHSWGAALALEYAAAYPDHTVSAVLSGTYISTPHWITGTNLLIRQLPDAVQADLAACEGPNPPAEKVCKAATKAFYDTYNGRADAPTPPKAAFDYMKRYRGAGRNSALYNAMWGSSEFSATGTLLDYNATPLLSKIDGSRTLFMVGQYDEARIDDVQEFAQLAKGSELAVIPGGSHSFLRERPAIAEAILRSWLNRKDAE